MTRPTSRLVRWATAYEGIDDEDTLSVDVPEDLSELDNEALNQLLEDVREAAEAIASQETLSDPDVEVMEHLADAAERILAERSDRSEREQERRERIDANLDRIVSDSEEESEDIDEPEASDGPDDEPEPEEEPKATEPEETPKAEEQPKAVEEPEVEEPELVAASAEKKPQSFSISLSGVRQRQRNSEPPEEDKGPRLEILAAADVDDHRPGSQITFQDVVESISRRAMGINEASFRKAAQTGDRLTKQWSVAKFRKPMNHESRLTADSSVSHTYEVLKAAASERNLPQHSLTAAGGWCSPSETMYELFDPDESADGLLSLPEVEVDRGGLRFARAPDFATIYSDTGFCFTEDDAIAGDYDPDTAGTQQKTAYAVDCPNFLEERLRVCGVWIKAGILQSRSFPEMLEAVTRKALIAHEHRLSANALGIIANTANSTAVDLTGANTSGATAPLLAGVELQVWDMRYRERLSTDTSLEAIFPFWLKGVLRSDLSKRLGVDMVDVPDARMMDWFRQRGINVQFVYDWQTIGGSAPATSWNDTVDFLLYPAGTWVRGTTDIITLDTIYDSTLLADNDFSSLFTEEGYLVIRLGNQSRVVSVTISPDGATAAGEALTGQV